MNLRGGEDGEGVAGWRQGEMLFGERYKLTTQFF